MKMRNSRDTPLEVLVFLLGIVAGWQWGYMWADARRQIKEANVSKEFKAGDRVRVIQTLLESNPISHWVGHEGTLIANTVSYYPWIVTGEAFDDEHGEGLPVLEEEIEHVGGEV